MKTYLFISLLSFFTFNIYQQAVAQELKLGPTLKFDRKGVVGYDTRPIEYNIDQFNNIHIVKANNWGSDLQDFVSEVGKQYPRSAFIADVKHHDSFYSLQKAGFTPLIIDDQKTQWIIRNGSSMPEPSTAAAGASVIVQDDQDNVLVIEDKNRAGRFTFPGGYVNKKEFPIVAAARELKEEVGLETGLGNLVEVARVTRLNANRWGFSDYAHFFFTKKFTGNVVIDPHEIKQAMWVPVAQLASNDQLHGLRITALVKLIATHLKNNAAESSSQFIPDLRQQLKNPQERDANDTMYVQLFAQRIAKASNL